MSNFAIPVPRPLSPRFDLWIEHAGHPEREAALATLLCEPRFVNRYTAAILRCAEDQSETIRELAVRVMVHCDPLPAREIGQLARKNQPYEVRLAAAQGLANAGQAGSAGAGGVATCLISPNEVLRRQASIALGKIGAASVDPCCSILRATTDPAAVIATLDTLAMVGADAIDAIPEIRRHTESRLAMVRAAAAAAMVSVASTDEDLQALRELMDDTDASIRHAAIERSGMLGDRGDGLIPRIRQAVDDADPSVRAAALLSVLRLSDSPIHIARLSVRRLADADAEVRRIACMALGRTGRVGRPALGRLHGIARDDQDIVAASASRAIVDISAASAREPNRNGVLS